MNCPVQALEKIWPGLKIVHGRPRHPQSQGSVERANAEVSKLVRLCKEEAGGSWVKALPRAQLKLNMNYHSGIKCSPIEALYGLNCFHWSCIYITAALMLPARWENN